MAYQAEIAKLEVLSLWLSFSALRLGERAPMAGVLTRGLVFGVAFRFSLCGRIGLQVGEMWV